MSPLTPIDGSSLWGRGVGGSPCCGMVEAAGACQGWAHRWGPSTAKLTLHLHGELAGCFWGGPEDLPNIIALFGGMMLGRRRRRR